MRSKATVYPVKKGCRIVSYKFKAYLGKDENQKQIFRCMTWVPPEGLPAPKRNRAAQRAADQWEAELKEQEVLPPPKKQLHQEEKLSLLDFIQKIWLPLEIEYGERKPTTVTFYSAAAKLVCSYFQ